MLLGLGLGATTIPTDAAGLAAYISTIPSNNVAYTGNPYFSVRAKAYVPLAQAQQMAEAAIPGTWSAPVTNVYSGMVDTVSGPVAASVQVARDVSAVLEATRSNLACPVGQVPIPITAQIAGLGAVYAQGCQAGTWTPVDPPGGTVDTVFITNPDGSTTTVTDKDGVVTRTTAAAPEKTIVGELTNSLGSSSYIYIGAAALVGLFLFMGRKH